MRQVLAPGHPVAVIEEIREDLFSESGEGVAILLRLVPRREIGGERRAAHARGDQPLEERRAERRVPVRHGNGVDHEEIVRRRLRDGSLVRLDEREDDVGELEKRSSRVASRQRRHVAFAHRDSHATHRAREIFRILTRQRRGSVRAQSFDDTLDRRRLVRRVPLRRPGRERRAAKLSRRVDDGGVVRRQRPKRAPHQPRATLRQHTRAHDHPAPPALVESEPRERGSERGGSQRGERRVDG